MTSAVLVRASNVTRTRAPSRKPRPRAASAIASTAALAPDRSDSGPPPSVGAPAALQLAAVPLVAVPLTPADEQPVRKRWDAKSRSFVSAPPPTAEQLVSAPTPAAAAAAAEAPPHLPASDEAGPTTAMAGSMDMRMLPSRAHAPPSDERWSTFQIHVLEAAFAADTGDGPSGQDISDIAEQLGSVGPATTAEDVAAWYVTRSLASATSSGAGPSPASKATERGSKAPEAGTKPQKLRMAAYSTTYGPRASYHRSTEGLPDGWKHQSERQRDGQMSGVWIGPSGERCITHADAVAKASGNAPSWLGTGKRGFAAPTEAAAQKRHAANPLPNGWYRFTTPRHGTTSITVYRGPGDMQRSTIAGAWTASGQLRPGGKSRAPATT